MDYRITLEELPAQEDAWQVVQGLVGFNDRASSPENWRRLAAFVRDGEQAIHGGVLGYTHWNWLFVSHLWVDERLRGLGYGRALLREAEAEALRRGCAHAHLDTFSFQAREFYESQGYQVFGVLDDYPPGHRRFFMTKHQLQR